MNLGLKPFITSRLECLLGRVCALACFWYFRKPFKPASGTARAQACFWLSLKRTTCLKRASASYVHLKDHVFSHVLWFSLSVLLVHTPCLWCAIPCLWSNATFASGARSVPLVQASASLVHAPVPLVLIFFVSMLLVIRNTNGISCNRYFLVITYLINSLLYIRD